MPAWWGFYRARGWWPSPAREASRA